MITPATTSAATGSSMPSQGMPSLLPSHAALMPMITTNVLHTSVEKCSASASSASLGYFLAMRLNARERTRSMPMASARIMIAVALGRICTA